MAMTERSPAAARRAAAGVVLTTVAQTIRFLLLDRRTWVSARYAEPERDMLRGVVARIEAAAHGDALLGACPLCTGHTCTLGCPLESVREMVKRHAALADATPETEADRK